MSKIPVLTAIRIIPRETEFLDRKSGSRGEIFYDRDANTLRLYDGDDQGGVGLARADFSNIANKTFRGKSVESRLATVIYTVTVVGPQAPDVGNKYVLNGVYRPIPNFVVGYTYVFNQDDATNVYFPNAAGTAVNRHPLNFSADNISGERGGGTSYLADVQYSLNGAAVTQAVYNSSAFDTATARQVQITITNATPATLYYWCYNHVLMGNEIAVADPGSGTGGGGSITVSVGSGLPGSPSNGNLWLNTNNGSLYVYINDGDSNQWIQPAFSTPDLTNYATKTYVDSKPGFEFYVAADDSTQVRINTGNVVQFIGAGGVTTSSDADGNITITGGGTTGNVTFATTTIDTTDSSAITFAPAVSFDSDVTVGNDLKVDRIDSVNGINPLTVIPVAVFSDHVDFNSNITVSNQLFVKNIDTIDSSAVTFVPAVNFSSDVNVDNDLTANNLFVVSRIDTSKITSSSAITLKSSSIIFEGLSTFDKSTEIVNGISGATGTIVHDFDSGSLFLHSSIAANFTANFTNVPTTDDRSITVALILDQGATAYIPNAVQINGGSESIKWSGGSEPSGTNNYTDIVNFTLIRFAGSWTVLGSLSTYN